MTVTSLTVVKLLLIHKSGISDISLKTTAILRFSTKAEVQTISDIVRKSVPTHSKSMKTDL